MRILDKLTNAPSQRYTVITDAGDQVFLTLRYMPTQQSWIVGIAWSEFEVNGLTMVASPNLLRGYMNVLPFGLMVVTDGAIEPSYLDDFTSGRVKVYIMSTDDVEFTEARLTA